MLGISLPIAAATAVILVADPMLLETRVIALRCAGQYGQHEVRFDPASYVTISSYFGPIFTPRQYRSHAIGDLDHYIEFHIDNDPSWKMRIDWRAPQTYSTYFITQEFGGRTETVDAGFCRESRESPQFDRVPTANAQEAEIKVVVPEIREKAPDGRTTGQSAVITVTGHFRKGDNIRFFDAVEKIQSATVYFDSPGGNVSAGIGIGEIIHERNFHTAVINYGRCLSACAVAWLGGTKRYLGGFAEIGFHGPFTKKNVVPYDTIGTMGWTFEASPRGTNMVIDYVTGMLGLKKETAAYVTMAPPQKLTYLTPEDGEKYGIEFTRINIPAYNPLP
jgi:hypothetical protein